MVTRIKATEQPAAAGAEASPLAGLIAQADAADGAEQVAQAAAQAPAPASDSTADDLFDLLVSAREAAEPAVEEWMEPEHYRATWSDQRLRRIGDPLAAILQRHGVTLVQLLERWGPYVALIAASGPPVLTTLNAYRKAHAKQPARVVQPPGEGAPNG